MPKIDGKTLNTSLRNFRTATDVLNHLHNWWETYQTWREFSVTIREGDDFYALMVEWLAEKFPATKQARVETLYYQKGGINSSKILFRPQAQKPIPVDIYGHRVTVTCGNGRKGENEGLDVEDMLRGTKGFTPVEDELVFHCASKEGQDAVKRFLVNYHETKYQRKPSIFYWTGNYWSSNGAFSPRLIETIILPNCQMERLVGDLDKFLNSEERYRELGTPYHRGYLLYGPPGGGKTSIVKGLASHFGLNLFILPMGDIERDSTLIEAVSKMTPGSILLMEDMDTFSGAIQRTGRGGELSMGGLLNALDGVATPHGMISIATTNHVDKLDPAIVREGRLDIKEHITFATADQIRRLWKLFFPEEKPFRITTTYASDIATSAIHEVLKRNMDDADGARKTLTELLGKEKKKK